MTIYFVTIFILVLLGAFFSSVKMSDRVKLLIVFVCIFFMQIVYGTRYEVGHDWFSYIRVYDRLTYSPWSLDTLEIGYKAINVLAKFLGGEIKFVIFMSTFLFLVFTFWGALNAGINPFYFFAIVAPYHLVMSGMNLTAQSIALGVSVLSFSYIMKQEKLKFLLSILFASTFHSSAILLLPFLLIKEKKRYLIAPALIFMAASVYFSIAVYSQYLDTEMDNAGMFLRVGFVAVSSFIFILNYSKVKSMGVVFYRLCMSCILSIPLFFIVGAISTTMADRFSYYIIILSAMLVMKLAIKEGPRLRYLSSYGPIIIFSASLTVFLVWTFFSGYVSSYYYNSYLIG